VVASGCVVGKVPAEAAGTFGVPEGAAVAVPLGDNPASLVATLTEPQAELALTLGTGGQLSAVLPPRAPLLVEPGETGFEYRPFPGGLFMAVAASLCGGSAWRWLARVVQDWLADLGQPGMPEERVFEIMNRAGAAAAGRLTVVPRFQGERHDPALRGRIEGIALDNFTLGEVARSLADGIAANLRDMLPARLRQSRLRIRGSGNALSRNPLLQSAAERAFGLPLEMADIREEAAVGAAFVAAGRVPGGPRAPAGGPRPSLTGPTEA
jgi:sedoheptulokinase